VTYPNVLVMGYLKQTGQLTPERRAKLESAILAGYQRVLTFQTEGGFDWYGRPPAKTILTAYGILMLSDMARVHAVDESVIRRAVQLLERRQNADGSWSLDAPMHTWYQLGQERLPLTAYVAWALLESGSDSRAIPRAVTYVESHWAEVADPYSLALCANALVLAKSRRAADALAKLESSWPWRSNLQGATFSRGDTVQIETTALGALALVRGNRPGLIDQALTALARAKDPAGGWHTTQSTILAIKALLEAAKAPKIEKPFTPRVRVNGSAVEFDRIGPANSDVVQQRPITEHLRPGENLIEIEADSEAPLTFLIASRHYVPWDKVAPLATPPVTIDVGYDKSKLTLGEELRCDVTIRFQSESSFMLIADLGIPAGFVPVPEDLDELVAKKTVDKYTLTGRQITLYFNEVTPGRVFALRFRMRPRFAVRTVPPPARVYEYYSPSVSGRSRSGPLEVVPE
jgi:uncharacterized protein YfaS (alpha-2-macroglobulin family)